MQFLSNIDLAKNELQNARLHNLASHPASPVPGQPYFNTTDKRYYGWTGDAWIDLGQVLTGAAVVTLINASSSVIDDDNLSATVADALIKRHAHANADVLNAMEAAFTTALKDKLDGIAANANNYVHPNHSGDVTSTGDGATTIANNRVTNAKLADMPTATIKGRVAAGTGDPTDLTAAQVKTLLELDKKADLDADGKVLASQLPSYVDDVLEFTSFANFPTTGESGKIYVAMDSNLTYRWSGSTYVEISASLALGETSSTAYRGDRGKIAYDHSQVAHAPANAQKNSDITKAEIEAKLTGAITSHTHPAAQITESTTRRFVSDAEKDGWTAKAGKYAAAVGNGSLTEITVTHNLGTQDVAVTVRRSVAPFDVVYPDVEITSTNAIKLLFATAPTTNQFRVAVIG